MGLEREGIVSGLLSGSHYDTGGRMTGMMFEVWQLVPGPLTIPTLHTQWGV